MKNIFDQHLYISGFARSGELLKGMFVSELFASDWDRENIYETNEINFRIH